MRTIEFRAKPKQDWAIGSGKEWIYGTNRQDEIDNATVFNLSDFFYFEKCARFISETLTEGTGFIIEGTKLFEGDRVRMKSVFGPGEFVEEVLFNKGEVSIGNTRLTENGWKKEIVGNKFEELK